jgi:hypothetical protein
VTTLAFGDLDGNGREELAVGRSTGDGMRFEVHRWAAGRWSQVAAIGHGWGDDRYTRALAFGDVDGDGDEELTVGRDEGRSMRLALYDRRDNALVEIAALGDRWAYEQEVTGLAMADLDGDRRAEVISGISHGGPWPRLMVHRWTGSELALHAFLPVRGWR